MNRFHIKRMPIWSQLNLKSVGKSALMATNNSLRGMRINFLLAKIKRQKWTKLRILIVCYLFWIKTFSEIFGKVPNIFEICAYFVTVQPCVKLLYILCVFTSGRRVVLFRSIFLGKCREFCLELFLFLPITS